MAFQFNVNVTEQDYIDYNMFVLTRTPSGKKQIMKIKITATAIYAVGVLAALLIIGLSKISLVIAICALAGCIVYHISFNKSMKNSFIRQMETMKKNGNLPYSPCSVLQFYDKSFIEITQMHKNETAYAAIERIDIVDNKIIYIFINSTLAYLLPLAAFSSAEQYNAFSDFIKARCNKINYC